MPFDVVVVGNIGIDTNVYLKGRDIDFNVEANFTEDIDMLGQAGGYSARGFAKLDRKTAFFGTVGDDFSGRFIREVLQADGIDTSGIWIDPAGTNRSVNLMYQDGRRKNFYDGKSHMTLSPDLDAFRKLVAGAKLVHFSIPNWARFLLNSAKDAGTVISIDIQDLVDVHDPYRTDFFLAADYLFFSGVNFQDPTAIMHEIWKMNSKATLICGMGAKGCALGYNNEVKCFPPIKMKAPVIDTNGAGDALATGFLDRRVFENRTLEESIHAGQIAARYKCTVRASSDHMISRGELEKLSHE